MIDWARLAAQALWISGCALALATLSFAYWEAATHGESLRARLSGYRMQVTLYLAGALFCAGLASRIYLSLEQSIWVILTLIFAGQSWITWRKLAKMPRES